MIDERSHPAGVARSHQARMPEPTPEPRDLLLEAAGVDGERQRAGQHLHQEAAAGRLFERHEHAAIADGPHLALHPVGGLERVPQCRAEISHERANMVAGRRRPQPSLDRHRSLTRLSDVQPWAYREFIRTGAFPERTMFVLSFYEASRKSAPARAGFYEGDRMPGIEVHLKQKGIDKTGWGFFGFGDGAAPAMMIPGAAPCYSCHATEAAHDQVFTQFYPPLRERLARASAH